MFISNPGRRLLAAAFMVLLAVAFVVGVLGSNPALVGQLMRTSEAILGFGDGNADTAEATVQETTADLTNEAEDPMPEEAAFDAAFVHRAAPENIVNNSTYLDNALTNGDPDTILYVTQNWNPGGGPGTYNDHPVGVWYDANRMRWAVFNQDLAAMPEGAAFNVVVLDMS